MNLVKEFYVLRLLPLSVWKGLCTYQFYAIIPPPSHLLGKGWRLCENLTKVNLPTALRVFNYRVCPAIEAIDWQGGGV